jgi:hypothetical protein
VAAAPPVRRRRTVRASLPRSTTRPTRSTRWSRECGGPSASSGRR